MSTPRIIEKRELPAFDEDAPDNYHLTAEAQHKKNGRCDEVSPTTSDELIDDFHSLDPSLGRVEGEGDVDQQVPLQVPQQDVLHQVHPQQQVPVQVHPQQQVPAQVQQQDVPAQVQQQDVPHQVHPQQQVPVQVHPQQQVPAQVQQQDAPHQVHPQQQVPAQVQQQDVPHQVHPQQQVPVQVQQQDAPHQVHPQQQAPVQVHPQQQAPVQVHPQQQVPPQDQQQHVQPRATIPNVRRKALMWFNNKPVIDGVVKVNFYKSSVYEMPEDSPVSEIIARYLLCRREHESTRAVQNGIDAGLQEMADEYIQSGPVFNSVQSDSTTKAFGVLSAKIGELGTRTTDAKFNDLMSAGPTRRAKREREREQ